RSSCDGGSRRARAGAQDGVQEGSATKGQRVKGEDQDESVGQGEGQGDRQGQACREKEGSAQEESSGKEEVSSEEVDSQTRDSDRTSPQVRSMGTEVNGVRI